MSDAPLTPKIREALLACGFRERYLARLNMNTDLIRDMGIFGDTFDEVWKTFSDIYGTAPLFDESRIPSEFSREGGKIDNARLFPFLARYIKVKPLTLAEFEEAFITGKDVLP